ncbi:MAG: putative viral replication protein [Cressdnaviricota sp.]|nr:MAG: putative viral replication protein [Cressdnaviricota sp.]
MKKHVAYCLTINNPILSDFMAFKDNKEKYFSYYIVGHEGYAPNRTPHLQCVVTFNTPQSWKDVKKMFSRAHIEQLKYDFNLAVEYCKKEGVFEEFGDFKSAQKQVLTFLLDSSKVSMQGQRVSITPTVPASPVTPSPMDLPYEALFFNPKKEQDKDGV